MLLIETTIFYLLLGVVVAVANYLRTDGERGDDSCHDVDDRGADRKSGAKGRGRLPFSVVLELAAACLFWPFYLPMLLAAIGERTEALSGKPLRESGVAAERDALGSAIEQVEAELDAALQGLDGWAEDVLNCEARRLTELRSAWRQQAERIRQLDRLLDESATPDDPLAFAAADVGQVRHSEEVRRENIRQLAALRKQLHGDLIGTLAWVRELVTMIHLAKFSGAPAARAEELVAQIAAAVQGLSEVSAWREEELVSAE
jgi:hypothetical protein